MSAERKKLEDYASRLENAQNYSEIWEIVKETTRSSLGLYRVGIMLFLDDLSLNIGAYHPFGTNNIVLNRALVQVVEAATKSRKLVNAFVYVLLLHEYLHALGYVAESDVRPMVNEIAEKSFGKDSIVTKLAEKGPWTLLEGIPLNAIQAPKRVMEIVKDFEKSTQKYIS
ncbi:MAG: hypothetical protein ACQXXH_04870 [Candidatus Bathyarchaeia archaeon]|jgi:hypothetical protein|nr:hypothetical protein [Candidatus Bathyarchaeota archaeon A05DMB-4]MDH7595066.1 hypothetical protein [Candidatus Bathyarchaeota archaeon]